MGLQPGPGGAAPHFRASRNPVIGCAGFNKDEWFQERLKDWPAGRLEEQIVSDVTLGMDGTGIRGGVIKFGTGYNHISEVEERVIRAAARAHRRTGAVLHGHTELGTMALEQIDILRDEGVDLHRVGLVHLMRNPDWYLHKQIAQTGAFLCCDGFSKIKYFPESVRIDVIIRLIEDGHQRQILIGGDLARPRQGSIQASVTGPPTTLARRESSIGSPRPSAASSRPSWTGFRMPAAQDHSRAKMLRTERPQVRP